MLFAMAHPACVRRKSTSWDGRELALKPKIGFGLTFSKTYAIVSYRYIGFVLQKLMFSRP